jgi:hypothetical protein
MSALEQLENDGIIEPVQHSSWAAPSSPLLNVMDRYICVEIIK